MNLIGSPDEQLLLTFANLIRTDILGLQPVSKVELGDKEKDIIFRHDMFVNTILKDHWENEGAGEEVECQYEEAGAFCVREIRSSYENYFETNESLNEGKIREFSNLIINGFEKTTKIFLNYPKIYGESRFEIEIPIEIALILNNWYHNKMYPDMEGEFYDGLCNPIE